MLLSRDLLASQACQTLLAVADMIFSFLLLVEEVTFAAIYDKRKAKERKESSWCRWYGTRGIHFPVLGRIAWRTDQETLEH